MTTPQPGTDPLDTAIEAACRWRLEYVTAQGDFPIDDLEVRLDAQEPEIRGMVRAAAPHIERAALLRAAEDFPRALREGFPGSLGIEGWLRARAEAVGTDGG